jgi:hypothetical protein
MLQPNIDSLNQLYFNYRVYLLPKVAGTDVLSSGLHSITGSDFTLTGWVDASAAVTNYGFPAAPTNARYFYNIPTVAQIAADTARMLPSQRSDAILLKQALPPYPAAYTNLFMNGVLQTQYEPGRTSGGNNDTSLGAYAITDAGIWWLDNRDGYVPWTYNSNVVQILLQTTKLNPAFQSSIITSLAPFKDGANDTSKVLTLVDKFTKQPATQGDLLAKFALNLANAGNVSWAAGKTVNNLAYDALNGNLVLTLGDSVSSVSVGPGLSVANVNGAVTVGLSSFTLSGEVTELDPEEADYVYKGLHTFLRLRNPVGAQKSGFAGRILLPPVLPSAIPLTFSLMAFGDVTAGTNAQFLFQYSVSQVSANAITDAVVSSGAINISGFQQNKVQTIKLDGSSQPYFQVPASALVPNSFLNFRITRVASSSPYTGNVNVIAVLWTLS